MEKKSILIVEDNADDIELALRAFKKTGLCLDIQVAKDGEKALSYLFDSSLKVFPEIILLDLKIPKLDGIDVLKSIKSNSKTKLLPVIVLTSSLEEKDLFNAYDLGANSYVRKPVDFNEFVDSIQKIASYWLQLNKSPISDKSDLKEN